MRKDKLHDGKIEALIRWLAGIIPNWRKRSVPKASYIEGSNEGMRYPEFRKQGLFVGSDVIDASCKMY